MAELGKENRQDRREGRQERRAERQKKRDVKLGEQITAEAKGYGVELDKPILTGPLGPERKAEIDRRISEYAQEDLREGLKKFQQLRKAPDVDVPKPLEAEQLKRHLRQQKRARFADMLTALGRGFAGKPIDPSMLPSAKIRGQREAQYQQYKEASQAAKQRMSEWESKYMDEQLDYLDERLKDRKTSELEKQKIRQIQAQIEKTQAETKWRKRQALTPTAAARGPYPTYEYKTKEGQTIKIPMPGDKKDARRLNTAMLSANKLKAERDRIQGEMDDEIYRAESEGWFGKSKKEVQDDIRAKHQPDLDKAALDLESAEIEINRIFEGKLGEERVATEEDDIWNL